MNDIEIRKRLSEIRSNFNAKYPDKSELRELRERLSKRQSGLCARGKSPLPPISDGLWTEIIRKEPAWSFAESSVPVGQAIAEANAEDNLDLVCNNCKRASPKTKPFVCGDPVPRDPKKKKEYPHRFIVQVDDQMWNTLEAIRSASNVSTAETVRRAIQEYTDRLKWQSANPLFPEMRPDRNTTEHQMVNLRRSLEQLFYEDEPWTTKTVRLERQKLFDALVKEGLLDASGPKVTVSRHLQSDGISKLIARLAQEHLA